MAMTQERIAEIEELAATKAPMVYVRAGSIRELCRLARLGMMVEAAPTVHIGGADGMSAFLIKRGKESLPSMQGKRVALVVLEDSE